MKIPVVNVPLTYDAAPEIGRLRMLLGGGADSLALAHFYYLRLWVAWGQAQTEWRPLENRYTDQYEWTKEPLTFSVEEFLYWKGAPGALMDLLLKSGVISVQSRGDVFGLTVAGFWTHNAHLDPGYKTIQAKGGYAAARANMERRDKVVAGQQAQLLLEPVPGMSEQRKAAAVQVVIRIYRCCGMPTPTSKQYTAEVLLAADAINVKLPATAMTTMEAYYYRERENPALGRDPVALLNGFEELYEKIK